MMSTTAEQDLQNMQTTYNASFSNSNPQQPSSAATGATANMEETIMDRVYISGVDGLLKLVEIVFSCTVLICASVWERDLSGYGGAFTMFVSTSSLVLTAVIYTMYIFKVPEKLRASGNTYNLVEFVFYLLYVLLYLTCAIIAAVNGWRHSAIAAASAFCFLIAIPYGYDEFNAFLTWRSGSDPPMPTHNLPATTPLPRQMDNVASMEKSAGSS